MRIAIAGIWRRLGRLLIAAALLPGAQAAAQSEAPLGQWAPAGAYCARDVRVVVPPTWEGISFGNGMELRPVGRERDTIEINSFPRRGGMPDFDGFVARLRLDCREGFAAADRVERLEADGLMSLGVLERRCEGSEGAYGYVFARADLEVAGAPHDVSVMALYGDVGFQIAGAELSADELPSDETARALVGEIVVGLGPCAP